MINKRKENRHVSSDDSGKFSGFSGKMEVKQILSYLKTPLFLLVFSVGSIFVHDFVTQSPLFMIRQIKVLGNNRVKQEEVLKLSGLTKMKNIFKINVKGIEKKLCNHPWIESARLDREFFSGLIINLTEQKPLAVANIENIVRVVINTQGIPFKEYDPERDHLAGLPVISGLDLTLSGSSYEFQGPLFKSIMKFLNTNPESAQQIITVNGDNQTGVLIHTRSLFDNNCESPGRMIPVSLGFDHFREKLERAREISSYISKNFPDKTIHAIDLFDMKKAFIKVKDRYGKVSGIGKGV